MHTLSLTEINCFTTTTSANNNTLVTELNKHRAALITDARSLIESSNTASHSFSMEAPANNTFKLMRLLFQSVNVNTKYYT